VVVIRYFGGILLGAPGLVRAYSQAAREVLAASGSKRLLLSSRARLTLSYHLWEPVRYQLEKLGAKIENIDYQSEVKVCFVLPQANLQAAQKLLAEYMVPLKVEAEQKYL
jgi:putative IMPACT (imprinted ancient) family translation regulator